MSKISSALILSLALVSSRGRAYADVDDATFCELSMTLAARLADLDGGCGLVSPAHDPSTIDATRCEQQLSEMNCSQEVRAWYADYFQRLDACLATQPVCTPPTRERYLEDTFRTCFERVARSVTALPTADCGISWIPPPPPPPPPNPTIDVRTPRFWMSTDQGPARYVQVSALALLGSGFSDSTVGVHALLAYPLLDRLSFLNDALYLELGVAAHVGFWVAGTALFTSVLGGVRYDLYLTPAWSVYLAARTGPQFALRFGTFGFRYSSGIGGQYRFSDSTMLRIELTGGNRSFYGISAGVTFDL
ncbi:MAG: hypothetical protein RIT81_14560 [Deltaproteobacteria bacterium]